MSQCNFMSKSKQNKKKPLVKKRFKIEEYFYDHSYPRKIHLPTNDLAYLNDLDTKFVIKELIWPAHKAMSY